MQASFFRSHSGVDGSKTPSNGTVDPVDSPVLSPVTEPVAPNDPPTPTSSATSAPSQRPRTGGRRSAFQIRTKIQIHEAETPAVFGHLFASVEQQVAVVGGRLWPDNGPVRAGVGPSSVLGVTSAIGGEGKTTVALHLALNAARNTFKSVCLIDLSLGENDLCRRLGVDSAGGGVMDALENPDEAAPTLPLVQLVGSDGLVILPAGKAPVNGAKAARSPRVAELIQAVRQMFDVVIVDLPAVQSDNTLPIAAHLDGVLMVVCAGATPKHLVNSALDSVGRERVLGVVLNRTTSSVPAWLRKRLGRT